MRYTILFENKPDATAPAQAVVITDQLDASKLDLSTFQLGPVSFGDKLIVPPSGLSEWANDVDLRPAKNLIVRVSAGLDQTTGLITWRFQSIDPATGQPPADPLAGFLPPNINLPEGEGSVLFTVMPKAGLATGTEIRNKARIVFDQNAPIDTPEWLNTIDNSTPASSVQPLAAQQASPDFTVNWAGTDTGSGVATYTIFVSAAGGPFTEWLINTEATSAVFHGQGNTSYAFYSIARDGAGNTEAAPAAADAATTTPACSFSLSAASQSFNSGGGTGSVDVTTTGGCARTAASNAGWITITAGATGSGNGTVSFTVGPNSGDPRTGTLTVAGLTFTITQSGAAPTVQFSAAAYSVGEGERRAVITVTRAGDTTSTSTVDYRTVDTDTFRFGCADTVNNQGGAYGRCDFATSLDTLAFAAGETQKTFTVPVIDDAIVEGAETFQVQLSNATGAGLGAPATATVTIQDNDSTAGPNPAYTIPFFVRQQYLDFLSREPEAGEPWSGVLTRCPQDIINTPPEVQTDCDRIDVSKDFFGSPEFQLKGVYVIVFYRVAFGRLPRYAEFVQDLRSVTGRTAPETLQKRTAFAVAFAQRPEFVTRYGALSAQAFVEALFAPYGLTQVTTPDPQNPDASPPQKVTLTKADLTARLTAGTLARAQVLRAVVEADEMSVVRVNVTAGLDATEREQAFVAAQYYGYLRRTPDTGGFQAWLRVLQSGDIRTMVNGFLNSQEYQLRFGRVEH